MKIVSTRLVGKLIDDLLSFRVFDVNWLVGTLRRAFRVEGILLTPGFCT